MKFDVITLDTNVFHANGLHLEAGLLRQLVQFKAGSAQFVLSEIVLRELEKHLVQKAIEQRNALASSLKKAVEGGLLGPKGVTHAGALEKHVVPVGQVVEQRLQSFVRDTGAIVVPASLAPSDEVLGRYFKGVPPFGKGGKKNEFPDAIALLSLREWARQNKKCVCAISTDSDWIEFAKGGDELGVVQDLGAALEMFQSHVAEVKTLVTNVLLQLIEGKHVELMDELAIAVASQTDALTAEAVAECALDFETDSVELDYQGFRFNLHEGAPQFDLVRVGKDEVAVRIQIIVQAAASASFSFSVHDSIDGDEVPMGSGTAEAESDFTAAIVVTLNGHLADSETLEVAAVELLEAEPTFDFGDIEPDGWRD